MAWAIDTRADVLDAAVAFDGRVWADGRLSALERHRAASQPRSVDAPRTKNTLHCDAFVMVRLRCASWFVALGAGDMRRGVHACATDRRDRFASRARATVLLADSLGRLHQQASQPSDADHAGERRA